MSNPSIPEGVVSIEAGSIRLHFGIYGREDEVVVTLGTNLVPQLFVPAPQVEEHVVTVLGRVGAAGHGASEEGSGFGNILVPQVTEVDRHHVGEEILTTFPTDAKQGLGTDTIFICFYLFHNNRL